MEKISAGWDEMGKNGIKREKMELNDKNGIKWEKMELNGERKAGDGRGWNKRNGLNKKDKKRLGIKPAKKWNKKQRKKFDKIPREAGNSPLCSEKNPARKKKKSPN